MRRRLAIVAVILLAGFLSAVGVAWGCGYLLDPTAGSFDGIHLPRLDPDIEWHLAIHRRAGVCRVHYGPTRLNDSGKWKGLTTPMPAIPEGVPVWGEGWPERDPYIWTQCAYGWPALCMWSRHRLTWNDEASRPDALAKPGLVLGMRRTSALFVHPRVIPFGVIPSGLLINTLVYAAIWGAVMTSVTTTRALVRRRRRRRGACPRCGHQLAGAARCPECGGSGR